MLLKASGPLGTFVRPVSKKYLFLSGGSGITPLMSMVRDLADLAEPMDIVFMHAARSSQHLVFRAELTHLAWRLKDLRLHFLPEDVSNERSWPGLSGRISKEYLSLAIPGLGGKNGHVLWTGTFYGRSKTDQRRVGRSNR